MKIGIIDYGMGNILSVINAVDYLGYDFGIIKEKDDFEKISKLILPGVGAFQDCMKNLKEKDFISCLNREVIDNEKTILGICLGMQVMAKSSNEGGVSEGLGWFDAKVEKIRAKDFGLKIPHIGWNTVNFNQDSFLFKGVPQHSACYFVHSYSMSCTNRENIIAITDYGAEITAAVHKNNIIATQFHPEKSQEIGLRILENFLEWEY